MLRTRLSSLGPLGHPLALGTWAFGPLVPWAPYNASLVDWAGKDVLIRWRISTDGGVTDTGWWIDDIEITNVGVPGDCSSAEAFEIFADGFESGNTDAW